MSILNTIKNWFFGKEDDAGKAPYKMEAPTLEEAVLSNTPSFPFPTSVGSVPVEGAGVVPVAAMTPAKKTKAPAKPKAKPAASTVKATAKAPAKTTKAPAKPKAKPAAKPKATSKKA